MIVITTKKNPYYKEGSEIQVTNEISEVLIKKGFAKKPKKKSTESVS
jgi:hypothetical protein